MIFSSTLLGTLSHYVYVNISGTDHIDCGSRSQPCRSLFYTINNISRPNDTICLIASPIKEIRYSLEKQIIIKHSLTVTKYPLVGLNPAIIYRVNATSSWNGFYAFASFRPAVAAAAEMLSLKMKSVNFNVNIFSSFSEGYRSSGKNMFRGISGFPLLLSISNSIIRSPNHAVNLSDLSGYENVSIHVEDSIIQNGRFMFQNKRESCDPMEHVRNTIEMNNVTVLNSGIVALSAHGCFNMSFNKLTCYNLTWKKQELLTFRGALLKMQNILIENIHPDNNKSEGEALFLIERCAVEIQNVRIKDCKVPTSMWLHKTSAVFLLQNSLVKLRNMKVIGNSFQNLARIESSFLFINNISLSNNIFNGTLCSVEKSNLKLNDAEFHSNSVGSLIYINLNSDVLITNNILSRNTIHENGYSLAKSIIRLKNVSLTRNNLMKNMLNLTSKSSAIIQNNTLTENNVSEAMYKLHNMSIIQLHNAKFTRNNLMKDLLTIQLNCSALIENNILTENNVSRIVYFLSSMSSIQLHNAKFTRNNLMKDLLTIQLNCSALIENNILTENNVSRAVYFLSGMSSIQLHNVTFTRNNLMQDLLYMQSTCSALIENNILTENNVSRAVYFLSSMSSIQLHNAKFTRNNLMKDLLTIQSTCSALIENNILTENNVSRIVYFLSSMSSIQLHNAKFTRNNLMKDLLMIQLNCSALIENNILTENNVSRAVYFLSSMSSIQLHNVTFTRNNLMQDLLYMQSTCSALIENNILTENNVSRIVYLISSMSSIQLNNVTFTRNNLMQYLLYMQSNSSAIVKNNTIVGNNVFIGVLAQSSNLVMDTILLQNNTFADHFILAFFSNNVSLYLMTIKENQFGGGIIQIENCVGRLSNTYIKNDDHFSVPAISATWTYEHHKYLFFELTNNTIIWSYESSLSFRPIIELTGRINISNVNVLVSSIAEIEVLQYSTKFIPVQSPSFQPFSNIYEVLSLFISCRRANVKYFAKYDTVRCTPCVHDKYTLHNGSSNISFKNLGNEKYKLPKESTHFTCDNCPAGANCTEYIKSKSNFYGYITKQQKVKFVPCPLNFCCSADQCKTITSCNKGRSSTLCGKCSKNNTESFLSTNCISVNLCKNFGKFWLIYCAYALNLATCLYYMKDLIVLIKTTGGKVSKVFKFFRKEKKIEGETDEMISIIGNEEQPEEKISHFTMSGIFALLVSFYQIKEVMAVDAKYKSANRLSFITFISEFINLEIVAIKSSSYCPMNDLNAVSKAFIKTYLLTVALIMASLMNYLISRLYYSFGGKLGRRSSLKPSDRLGVCLVRVLILKYKNMAAVSLILLNCVEVAGIRVLHINGDIKCFEWWQVIVAVFFCTWIIFFPLSLKLSYTMFMKDEITFPKFIFSLMVPFALVVYHIRNRNVVFVVLQKPRNVSKVQRILQEMFEESYRFKRNDSRRESIFYETWRLYQRVLLTFAATYFINPLVRITFITPIIILIAISYFAYRPYKPEMYILHWMEIVSILGFFVCLAHNMFRGFLYVYDIKHEYHITLIWEAFKIADLLFSPIWVLLWFFILKPVYNKVKNVIKKRM